MVQKIKFKKSKNTDWKQKSKKIKVQEKQKSKNAVKNTIKETIWKISQNWSLSDQKMPTMRVKVNDEKKTNTKLHYHEISRLQG